jgi:hypothetical protein
MPHRSRLEREIAERSEGAARLPSRFAQRDATAVSPVDPRDPLTLRDVAARLTPGEELIPEGVRAIFQSNQELTAKAIENVVKFSEGRFPFQEAVRERAPEVLERIIETATDPAHPISMVLGAIGGPGGTFGRVPLNQFFLGMRNVGSRKTVNKAGKTLDKSIESSFTGEVTQFIDDMYDLEAILISEIKEGMPQNIANTPRGAFLKPSDKIQELANVHYVIVKSQLELMRRAILRGDSKAIQHLGIKGEDADLTIKFLQSASKSLADDLTFLGAVRNLELPALGTILGLGFFSRVEELEAQEMQEEIPLGPEIPGGPGELREDTSMAPLSHQRFLRGEGGGPLGAVLGLLQGNPLEAVSGPGGAMGPLLRRGGSAARRAMQQKARDLQPQSRKRKPNLLDILVDHQAGLDPDLREFLGPYSQGKMSSSDLLFYAGAYAAVGAAGLAEFMRLRRKNQEDEPQEERFRGLER